MAKTKIVKFMCSIVLAVSLVLSQSYTAMASGSSTITEQQLGVLFDGMESIVVQLEEMGLTEEDPACFLIFHHISIKICRCGYDRFSFTAPDNLYCKVKYRHDTIPPFCRIRH